MALPTLQRKLFKNDGYGPEIQDGIVSRNISIQDWVSTHGYVKGAVARASDGRLFTSLRPSGPGTGASAIDPLLDSGVYWKTDKDLSVAIYVDPVNGSDANDGLSLDRAVQTISHALSYVTSTLSTVYLAAGTYAEDVDVSFSSVTFNLLGNVTINGHFSVHDFSVVYIESNNSDYSFSVSDSGTDSLGGSDYSDKIVYVYYSSHLLVNAKFNISIVANSGASSVLCIDSNSVLLCNKPVSISQPANAYINFFTFATRNNSTSYINNNLTITIADSTQGALFADHQSCVFVQFSTVNISDTYTGSRGPSGIYPRANSYIGIEDSTITVSGFVHPIYALDSSVISFFRDSGTFSCRGSSTGWGDVCSILAGSMCEIDGCTFTFNAVDTINNFVTSQYNSYISFAASSTITFTGKARYETMSAINNSLIHTNSATLSGSPNCKRYNVNFASMIHTNNRGANIIPGNAAGSVANYSIYY